MTQARLQRYSALAGGDSLSYQSVQVGPISRVERFAVGRNLRQDVPRASLGEWRPDTRPDPVVQIQRSHEGRIESLIPIRIGRMVSSPYGFLRGAASVMANDLSRLPATGITPVICGDAHLGNFGFYASPERDLVLDLNDFDEAHPGPWEWDLRRLVTSLYVAGRQNGSRESQCEDAVMSCVAAYRKAVRSLANQPLLSRSFHRMNVDRLQTTVRGRSLRAIPGSRLDRHLACAPSDLEPGSGLTVGETARRGVDHQRCPQPQPMRLGSRLAARPRPLRPCQQGVFV